MNKKRRMLADVCLLTGFFLLLGTVGEVECAATVEVWFVVARLVMAILLMLVGIVPNNI